MTPVELVTALYTAGCRLLPEGEQLRVQDPQHVLNEGLRQAIRTHKAELLRLLGQATSVRASPLAEAQAIGQSAMSNLLPTGAEDQETPAVAWRCPCCMGTRRWRSLYSVLICGTCHPPADAALVADWEASKE
jgi:hypothetical protein